jgi:biotin carboxyl carrier protein
MASESLEEPLVMANDPAWQALASFAGTAEAFWPLLLQALVNSSGARRALLLSSGVGLPWQAKAQWPQGAPQASDDARRSLRLLTRLSPQALCWDEHGRDLAFQPALAGSSAGEVMALLLLDLPQGAQTERLESLAQSASALVQRLSLPSMTAELPSTGPVQNEAEPARSADLPTAAPIVREQAADAHSKAQRLHDILHMARAIQQYSRFTPAAMALCNQLCARFDADRVSLGWRKGPSIRLAAISHVEHFDAKSNVTRALEEVMEEALEQESMLVYPPVGDTQAVLRAHGTYAAMVAPAGQELQLCSVPLDGSDGVAGVLCLERVSRPLDVAEGWELEQAGLAVSAWLVHLRDRDRGWVLRGWDAVRRNARQLLGPRHTAWKASTLTLALFLGAGSVWPWDYRVDATLAVRSRDLLFMPAPFDGYLRQVHVDVGDQVLSGATLVELDTRDLLLEESMAEADWVRYAREAEKAIAARQLAEMQIALARQQQAQAKLELTRFQLAHAQVKAPYDGVVIEGELKKNLGAPVRKGDLLLKLARTTRTYLELEIDQAYVHEVKVGTRGEFALVGRPGERFPITLTQLDPAAVNKDGRTVYLARAALQGQELPDWRPGMGGNARLDAGERPLIWVLTHRTVRFLREFFWL